MSEQGVKGEATTHDSTRARELHARRVAEVKALVPDLSLRTHARGADGPAALKAFAAALAAHPAANGAWRDGRIERYSRVNVALVLDGIDGPVTPTIFDADRKDLAALTEEAQSLVRRATSEQLEAPLLRGSTASFLDVSEAGIDEATPLLMPGHSVALALGGSTLTLTCDARVLHGPAAAQLLAQIAAAI